MGGIDKLTLRSTKAQAMSLRVAIVNSPPSTVTDSRTSPICMAKVMPPLFKLLSSDILTIQGVAQVPYVSDLSLGTLDFAHFLAKRQKVV